MSDWRSMEVELNAINVMYVIADGGPAGASDAFRKLEARLPGLKGRRFYGTYSGEEYRACVQMRPDDDPAALGLATCVVPGGKYARSKLVDWQERTPEIGETFNQMGEEHCADASRPTIEYYRSSRELVLLFPIE